MKTACSTIAVLLAIIIFLIWDRGSLRREVDTVAQQKIALEQETSLIRDAVEAEKQNEIRTLKQRLDYSEGRLAAISRTQPTTDSRRVAVSTQTPESSSLVPSPNSDFPSLPLTPIASSHLPTGELQHRSWGPEQLVGPPDTQQAGDIPTAWAPRDSTGKGEEWIHLNYDNAVELSNVRVRETYNPGAISKIAAVLPNGGEVLLWQGTEPTAQAPVDTSFSLPPGVTASSVKIYLDRTRVPGWNEIDAVELIGRDGSRQWASSAFSSTTYAEPASKGAVTETFDSVVPTR
jgi:hypothetical protein